MPGFLETLTARLEGLFETGPLGAFAACGAAFLGGAALLFVVGTDAALELTNGILGWIWWFLAVFLEILAEAD